MRRNSSCHFHDDDVTGEEETESSVGLVMQLSAWKCRQIETATEVTSRFFEGDSSENGTHKLRKPFPQSWLSCFWFWFRWVTSSSLGDYHEGPLDASNTVGPGSPHLFVVLCYTKLGYACIWQQHWISQHGWYAIEYYNTFVSVAALLVLDLSKSSTSPNCTILRHWTSTITNVDRLMLFISQEL